VNGPKALPHIEAWAGALGRRFVLCSTVTVRRSRDFMRWNGSVEMEERRTVSAAGLEVCVAG
jgi:hypothetical protein